MYKIMKGKCSKCRKDVVVWGDVKKKLCIRCDEENRHYMNVIVNQNDWEDVQ